METVTLRTDEPYHTPPDVLERVKANHERIVQKYYPAPMLGAGTRVVNSPEEMAALGRESASRLIEVFG